MTHRLPTILFVALLPFAASAQSKCDTIADAETERVSKELAKQAPSKDDQQAYMAWSRRMHDALAEVGRKHDECVRSSKPPLSAGDAAKIDACLAANNRRSDEVEKKYRGRNLTFQEQTAHRAEGQRLMDERMACTKPANR